MEELYNLVKELEKNTLYSRSNKKHFWESEYGIIGFSLLIVLVISIIFLPSFISILLLGAYLLCCYKYYRHLSQASNNNYNSKTFEKIYCMIENIKTKLNEKENDICTLHDSIKSLQSEQHISISEPNQIDQILKGHYNVLLETIQKMDITTMDFGEECHNYVRKEMEKAVRKCNLRFVDFCESTEDCYIVESSDIIDKVDYVARGIVSNEDNQVVLKGQVYIPSK